MEENIEQDAFRAAARKKRMLLHYALIAFNFAIIVFLFQKVNFSETDINTQISDSVRKLKVSSLRIEKYIDELRYPGNSNYSLLTSELQVLEKSAVSLELHSRPFQSNERIYKVVREVIDKVQATSVGINGIIKAHKAYTDASSKFGREISGVILSLSQVPQQEILSGRLIRLRDLVELYSALRSSKPLSEFLAVSNAVGKNLNTGQGNAVPPELQEKLKTILKGAGNIIKTSDSLNVSISGHGKTFSGEVYDRLYTSFTDLFVREGEWLNTNIIIFYMVLLGSWLHMAYLIYEIVKRNGKIEKQTRELQDNLEQQKVLNDLQRKFVSMVSHEFRTPLAIIDSGAQKLIRRADTLTPDKIKEVALKTRSHINKLIELLDSILHSQRMDAGAMEIMPGPCDLKLIISDVCQLQYEIHTRNMIILNISALPQSIIADSKLVGHVFTNLISNAVKYSPDGTEVRITGETSGDYVEVRIEDMGVGIPEDEISDLFSCFYRASTSVGISGTGIGLHLVKNIIDEHGGSIEVESVVGQGSCFTVRLPLTQPGYKEVAPEEREVA